MFIIMWESLVNYFSGLKHELIDPFFTSGTTEYDPVSSAQELANQPGNPLLNLMPNPRNPLDWLQRGGAIGALYNDLTGKTAQSKEFLQQNYLLDKEQDFAREMELRQEDYNSEVNRVKRMQDAGLNVNLMSGVSGSTVGSTYTPTAPSVNSAVGASGNAVGSMLDALMASSNIKKNESEVMNIDAQTGQILQDTFLKPISLYHQINLWQSTADKYCEEAGLAKENADFIRSQRMFFDQTKPLQKEKLQEDINHVIQESKLIRQKVKESQASVNLMKQEGEMYETYSEESQQRKLMMSQEYEAVENLLGGIPLSVDGKTRIATLLSSDNPDDNDLGEKLLQGVGRCVAAQEDAVIDANFQNIGKSLLMDIEQGIGNAVQFVPFMFGGKPRIKSQIGYK